MTIRKVGRDAISGRFIPLKKTRRFPGTTVVETVEVPKRRRARTTRRRAASHLKQEKQNR